MLNDILKMLADGSALNAVQLARHLGVTQGLVVQMLEDLEQRGYVDHIMLGCDEGKCSACSQHGACSVVSKASGWALTDRGRTLASKGL